PIESGVSTAVDGSIPCCSPQALIAPAKCARYCGPTMRLQALALSVLSLSCTPRTAAPPAAHPEPAANARVWIAPYLGVADADVAAALARPFEYPVPVQSTAEPPVQATIGSCHDYLRLRPQGY